LKQHHVLFQAEEEIRHVYFPPERDIAGGHPFVGRDGRGRDGRNDGVVGGSAALDGKVSLSRGIVQLPGDAIVCDIDG